MPNEALNELLVFIVCGLLAGGIEWQLEKRKATSRPVGLLFSSTQALMFVGMLLVAPVFLLLMVMDKTQATAHVWTPPEGVLMVAVTTSAMLGCAFGIRAFVITIKGR